jgi:HD-GYP domain-containing protein (c-di-GMP phosphodiesterase class II)
MSQAQNLIRTLEDNSLTILSESLVDVRTNGGPTLSNVSDEDLQIALYTVMLKIIDTLREKASAPSDVKTDTKAIFVAAIRDMMDYVDGQSTYTVGHNRAVTQHVVQMASRSGLSDADIDDIETAAWIHNIGMINQSPKLSALPRTLTQDELKQARNHTVMGAEMIRPIQFLSHLVPTIRYHHSRYDGGLGSGEPTGENLPFGARLICLADAYQAMLEPRAYRAALTRDQALLEIDKSAGTHFDPALVPLAHELSGAL